MGYLWGGGLISLGKACLNVKSMTVCTYAMWPLRVFQQIGRRLRKLAWEQGLPFPITTAIILHSFLLLTLGALQDVRMQARVKSSPSPPPRSHRDLLLIKWSIPVTGLATRPKRWGWQRRGRKFCIHLAPESTLTVSSVLTAPSRIEPRATPCSSAKAERGDSDFL